MHTVLNNCGGWKVGAPFRCGSFDLLNRDPGDPAVVAVDLDDAPEEIVATYVELCMKGLIDAS